MGKPSRDKGLRRERAIVEIHAKSGLRAERVPLSGATHYRGNGADVPIYDCKQFDGVEVVSLKKIDTPLGTAWSVL